MRRSVSRLIPRRWLEGARDPAGDRSPDQRIGALLRQLPEPRPLTPAQLSRVADRLPAGDEVRGGARPRRPADRVRAVRESFAPGALGPRRRALALRLSLGLALLLGTSGAVFARHSIARVLTGVTARITGEPAARARGARPIRPLAGPPGSLAAVEPATATATDHRPGVPLAPGAARAVLVPASDARGASPSPASAPRPRLSLALVTPLRSSQPNSSPPPGSSLTPPLSDDPAPPPLTALALTASPAARASSALGAAASTNPALVPAPLHIPEEIAPPPTPSIPAASPSPVPDRLGAEAGLLARAIESLRRHHDPAASLALLDQHRARFPGAALQASADLVRIDALLALGRQAEALALIEGQPLEGNPRADELQVMRGELHAAANDPTRALACFDRALAQPLAPTLAERALRGRSLCHLRQGGSADADLRAYLARFPDGPLAPTARAQLAH